MIEMSVWKDPKKELPPYYKDVLCFGENIYEEKPFRFYVARYTGEHSGWSIPGVGGIKMFFWKELPDHLTIKQSKRTGE